MARRARFGAISSCSPSSRGVGVSNRTHDRSGIRHGDGHTSGRARPAPGVVILGWRQRGSSSMPGVPHVTEGGRRRSADPPGGRAGSPCGGKATSWSTDADVSGRMRCGSTVRPRGWIDAALRSTSTVTSLGSATDSGDDRHPRSLRVGKRRRITEEEDLQMSADLSSSSSRPTSRADDSGSSVTTTRSAQAHASCTGGRRATGRRSLRPPMGDSPHGRERDHPRAVLILADRKDDREERSGARVGFERLVGRRARLCRRGRG